MSSTDRFEGQENKLPRVSSLVLKAASRLGVQVNLEPSWRHVGQIIAPDGRKFYFRDTRFDINPHAAAMLASDKDHAAHFMGLMGYPVPEGQIFYSDEYCAQLKSPRNKDAAFEYAEQLGFPVIVKPNSKSQGVGVAKVHNQADFYEALDEVFNVADDRIALVQRPLEGNDYRIVVLEDEVISAYQRIPLTVVGDGKSSVAELFFIKQNWLEARGRAKFKEEDRRIAARLRGMGFGLGTVLSEGQKLPLLDNANLSSGGDALDVTEIIHSGYIEESIRLVRDMNLRYCGVDLMTPEPIDAPPKNHTYLEINSALGVDNYALMGEVQQSRVEDLYLKLIQAMIK